MAFLEQMWKVVGNATGKPIIIRPIMDEEELVVSEKAQSMKDVGSHSPRNSFIPV